MILAQFEKVESTFVQIQDVFEPIQKFEIHHCTNYGYYIVFEPTALKHYEHIAWHAQEKMATIIYEDCIAEVRTNGSASGSLKNNNRGPIIKEVWDFMNDGTFTEKLKHHFRTEQDMKYSMAQRLFNLKCDKSWEFDLWRIKPGKHVSEYVLGHPFHLNALKQDYLGTQEIKSYHFSDALYLIYNERFNFL